MKITKILLFLVLVAFCSSHAHAYMSCTIDGISYQYEPNNDGTGKATGPAKVVGISAGAVDVVIPKTIVVTESSFSQVAGEYTVTEIVLKNNGAYSNKFKETIKSLTAKHITYFGDMYNCPLLESVVFGDDITYIGDLFGCPNLKKVEFGSKIESLGSFANCPKVFIGGLRLPATITFLGSFKGCTALKWIDLSACSKLKYLPTFENSGIESITWPASPQLTSIGEHAFKDCKNLSKVGTLPQSVTQILKGAFQNCTSLGHISLNNAIIKYEGCFSGCVNLTNITLSDNMTEIPASTFSGCVKLNRITLPDNVKTIGENAFYNCISLKGTKKFPFKLSANLTSIGQNAFYGCNGLEWVNYVKANNRVVTIEPYAFNKCEKLTEFVVTKKFVDVSHLSRSEIQSGIIVKANAFSGCTNLTCLPANIVSCPTNGFDYVPISAIRLPNYLDDVDDTSVSDLLGSWMASDKISTVYVSEGISNIKAATTQALSKLENIHFDKYEAEDRPEEMATLHIEANAFSSNQSIRSVVSQHIIPPVLHPDAFNERTYQNATLEVPEEAVEAYNSAEGWKKFRTINGSANDTESGIEPIVPENAQEVEYFNLQGLKMNPSSIPAGIYIRRQGQKVEKIIMK